jgi:hypothetical protein
MSKGEEGFLMRPMTILVFLAAMGLCLVAALIPEAREAFALFGAAPLALGAAAALPGLGGVSLADLARGQRDPVFGLRNMRRARIRFEVIPTNGTTIPTAEGLGVMRFSKGVHEAIVYADHLERDDMRTYGKSILSRTWDDRARTLMQQATELYDARFKMWLRDHPGRQEKDYGHCSPQSCYYEITQGGSPGPIAWVEVVEADLPPPEMTETVTARSNEALAAAILKAVRGEGAGASPGVAALTARLDALEAENQRLRAERDAQAKGDVPSADPKDAKSGKPPKGALLG